MPYATNTRRATLLLTAVALLVLACAGVSAAERESGSALWGLDSASPMSASVPMAHAAPNRVSPLALLAECATAAWMASRIAGRTRGAERSTLAPAPVRFRAPLLI